MPAAIAGRQLYRQGRAPAKGRAPGAQTLDAAQHAPVPVQKHHVDGPAHPQGMHGAARLQAQALRAAQCVRGKQTQQAPAKALGVAQGQGAVIACGHVGKSARIPTTMGKPMIRKVHGKMQVTSGNSIFTGAFSASASARRKRSVRR